MALSGARAARPWGGAVALLGLVLAAPAAGQPRGGAAAGAATASQRWLVVPSTVDQSGNPSHAARTAARHVSGQLDTRGKHVLRADEARRLFEQRGSAPAMAVSASAVDELARDAQQALYHVASGLHARAQKDVERAMDRARSALESLNRETRAARHLLDACMYLVRGHLERSDRDKARRQALECRRLVPDIAPDATVHPPNVIGVLAEAEADLLSRAPSSLRVEGEPSGCAVLINGRNLGTTPKELSRLSSGEYRIQVECDDGEPGRVHRVVLNSSRAVVHIDTRFDRVVQTRFDLSLRYDSAEAERAHAARDALEAARIVGASELVLVSRVRDGAEQVEVALQRLRVDDGLLLAETRLRLAAQGEVAPEALAQAVSGLLDRPEPPVLTLSPAPSRAREGGTAPRVEPASQAVLVLDPGQGTPPTEASQPGEPGRPRAAGRVAAYVAAGVGGALSVAGWALYGRQAGLQSDYAAQLNAGDPRRFDAYRRVSDLDAVPSIVLGLGSGALSLAQPGYLPAKDGVPWWAWASGALGVGVAGAGLKLALDAGRCVEDALGRCTEPALATRVGTLLLLQALPFVSVPVTYAVRALTGERVAATLTADMHGAYVVLGGKL